MGVLTVCLLSAGCANKYETVGEASTQVIEENTSEVTDESATGMEKASEVLTEAEENPIPEALSDNLNNILAVMDSYMMCMEENGDTFEQDKDAYWTLLYYILGNYGTMRDSVKITDSEMKVPREVVEEYASALFADYSELPDISKQQGPMISYDEKEDSYIFGLGDRGCSASKIVSSWDNGDGTYNVIAKLYGLEDDSTICTWVFTLIENEYADTIKDPLFYYSIANAKSFEEEYNINHLARVNYVDPDELTDNIIEGMNSERFEPFVDIKVYSKDEWESRMTKKYGNEWKNW